MAAPLCVPRVSMAIRFGVLQIIAMCKLAVGFNVQARPWMLCHENPEVSQDDSGPASACAPVLESNKSQRNALLAGG